jgi:hypothetical protein
MLGREIVHCVSKPEARSAERSCVDLARDDRRTWRDPAAEQHDTGPRAPRGPRSACRARGPAAAGLADLVRLTGSTPLLVAAARHPADARRAWPVWIARTCRKPHRTSRGRYALTASPQDPGDHLPAGRQR